MTATASSTPKTCQHPGCKEPLQLFEFGDVNGKPYKTIPGSSICDKCLLLYYSTKKESVDALTRNRNQWGNYSKYNADLAPSRTIMYYTPKSSQGTTVPSIKDMIEIIFDSKMGAIFQGDTGTGKTFAMFALSEFFVRQTGRVPAVFFAPRLRQEVFEASVGNDSAAKGRIINRLVSNELLFLDDIGNASQTESFDEVVNLVTEERLSQKGIPMFVTLQQSSAQFVNNSLRRDATLRRLLDHSLIFKFKFTEQ